MEGLVGAESVSNEEHEPFGGGIDAMTSLDSKRAHAVNDWTDKINVKDRKDIHGMEKDGHTEEAESSKARHCKKGMAGSSQYFVMDGKGQIKRCMKLMKFAWQAAGPLLRSWPRGPGLPKVRYTKVPT